LKKITQKTTEHTQWAKSPKKQSALKLTVPYCQKYTPTDAILLTGK